MLKQCKNKAVFFMEAFKSFEGVRLSEWTDIDSRKEAFNLAHKHSDELRISLTAPAIHQGSWNDETT